MAHAMTSLVLQCLIYFSTLLTVYRSAEVTLKACIVSSNSTRTPAMRQLR